MHQSSQSCAALTMGITSTHQFSVPIPSSVVPSLVGDTLLQLIDSDSFTGKLDVVPAATQD